MTVIRETHAETDAVDTASIPRKRLLDAAEAEFSRVGFGGATTKAIARAAGVAQGLLHYHFGTKEGLFEAVIARRSGPINEARLTMLEAVDMSAPDAMTRIFEAFFRPPLGPQGGAARVCADLCETVGRRRARTASRKAL